MIFITNNGQAMNFTLEKSLEILERTPNALITMLQDISADWTSANEGGETWSVYDIIGHLIHGEKTDWMPRTDIILSENSDKAFKPFDRFAQFEDSKGKSLSQLLNELKCYAKAMLNNSVQKNLPVKTWKQKAFILLSEKLPYHNFFLPGLCTILIISLKSPA